MAGIARVTLVDRGRYEASNLASQDIAPGDVGRRKAIVQARRLRRIAPELAVEAVTAAVEDLPLGRLRGDAIVAALDSRASRQAVNDAAFHLGVPWIDSGVMGESLLARVNVYVPDLAAPCLECAWDDRDYEALEVAYPCGGAPEAPATGAPSSLGALAAALAAIELRKLLDGDHARAAIGRQVIVDAACHRATVTAFARRALCRRGDHDPWEIVRLARAPREVTLESLRARPGWSIAVEGRRIQLRSRCRSCAFEKRRPRVWNPSRPAERCGRCGGEFAAAGFDLAERIEVASLGRHAARRTLAWFGVRCGDVIRVESPRGAMRRYEVGA